MEAGVFRQVFDKGPTAYLLLSRQGDVLAANRSAEALLGRETPIDPTSTLFDLFGDDSGRLAEHLALSTGTGSKVAASGLIRGGAFDGLRRRMDFLRIEDDGDVRVLAYVHGDGPSGFREHTNLVRQLNTELSRQRALAERLEEARARSDYLHRELIHRIKNNLTIIGGMIRIRARELEDGQARQELQAVALRIQSMSLVHQLLDRTAELEVVDAGALIEELCALLVDSLVPEEVDLVCDVVRTRLHVEDAIALCLLINELVSNALKHAFPEGRSGRISITLQQPTDTQLSLRVADDGAGAPTPIGVAASTGHGMDILHALADRLTGTLAHDQGAGMAWILTFQPRAPTEDLAAE